MKEHESTFGTWIYPFTDDPQGLEGNIQVFTAKRLGPEYEQKISLNIESNKMYSYVEAQQLILALQRAVEILREERQKRLQKEHND